VNGKTFERKDHRDLLKHLRSTNGNSEAEADRCAPAPKSGRKREDATSCVIRSCVHLGKFKDPEKMKAHMWPYSEMTEAEAEEGLKRGNEGDESVDMVGAVWINECWVWVMIKSGVDATWKSLFGDGDQYG
jgi:hypothetical protein